MNEKYWVYYLIEVIKADGVLHPEELRWLSTFASNMTTFTSDQLDELINERMYVTYENSELNEIINHIKDGDLAQNLILLSYCVDIMRADDLEAEAEKQLIERLVSGIFGEQHVELFMNWIDSDLKTKALWSQLMQVITSME